MEKYVALAVIQYYNELEEKIETEYAVLTGVSTFVEAMTQIEDYYGEDLEVCEISFHEGPLLHISNETFDKIVKGELP